MKFTKDDLNINQQYFNEIYDSFSITKSNTLHENKKLSNDCLTVLNGLLQKFNNIFSNLHELLRFIRLNLTINYCQFCNAILPFKKRNSNFCNASHRVKDANVRLKRENTFISVYGVKHNFLRKSVQQKAKLNSQTTEAKNKRKLSFAKLGKKPYEKMVKTKSLTITKCGSREKSKRFMFAQAYNKILSYNRYVEPLFTFDEYNGYSKIYKWKCVKCRK